MINISGVTFGYDGKHRVLQDFNLQMRAGGIYGLLGKNGTGKSTLLYLMMGLLRPQQGEVRVDGTPVMNRAPRVMQDMFLVPEEYDLPACSLRQYVETLRPFYPHFSDETLECCLQGFEMPLDLDLDLSALSMGQKKKVYMCVALATNTRYLLMDEPTNGLDIVSKSQFRKVLVTSMTPDKTVVISTHQVHDVEHLLDHVCIIDQNRVLLNAPLSEDNGPVDLEKLFIDVHSGKELTAVDGIGSLGDLGGLGVQIEESTVEITPVKPAWKKFLDVARWDLTTNRRFYLRAFALMVSCMIFPVALTYLKFIEYMIDGVTVDENFAIPVNVFSGTIATIQSVFGIVILGYVFHNLRTKQGRVSELTLPASNCQRFLWHALFTIVGGWLAIRAAVVVADLLQVVLAFLLAHQTSGFESLTLAVNDYSIIPNFLSFSKHPVLCYITLASMVYCFKSTFVLGNAWQYKNNMVLTILAHFALWMGLIVALAFLVNVLDKHAHELLNALLFWDSATPDWVLMAGLLIFCMALLAGIWAWAYRLYCRAQITTRRNK